MEYDLPLVPDGDSLLAFATHLFYTTELAGSSIDTYVSAVSGWFKLYLQVDARCNSEQLRAVCLAVKRVRKSARHQRRSLGWRELCTYLDHHRRVFGDGVRALRVRAALACAFHAFLRVGQYTADKGGGTPPIRRRDVTLHRDSDGSIRYATFRLRGSKTDRERRGTVAAAGPTGGPHCPMAYLARWLDLTRSEPRDSPLFSVGASRLTSSAVNAALRSMATGVGATTAGLDSHSLRHGACTDALAAGYSIALVRQIGRWAPDSKAMFTYVHKLAVRVCGVAKGIALAAHTDFRQTFVAPAGTLTAAAHVHA